MPRPLDTGFPASDARDDFSRARRQRALAKLAARLRGEPGDVDLVLVRLAPGLLGEAPALSGRGHPPRGARGRGSKPGG